MNYRAQSCQPGGRAGSSYVTRLLNKGWQGAMCWEVTVFSVTPPRTISNQGARAPGLSWCRKRWGEPEHAGELTRSVRPGTLQGHGGHWRAPGLPTANNHAQWGEQGTGRRMRWRRLGAICLQNGTALAAGGEFWKASQPQKPGERASSAICPETSIADWHGSSLGGGPSAQSERKGQRSTLPCLSCLSPGGLCHPRALAFSLDSGPGPLRQQLRCNWPLPHVALPEETHSAYQV